MTRHWPSSWTTPSRLAVCMLVLGSPLGCGLNKAPVKPQKSTEQASAEREEPIQTVGFISPPQGATAGPGAWQAAVDSTSLVLAPLPPVDELIASERNVAGGEETLPVERAEEVFGEGPETASSEAFPTPDPLAEAAAPTNRYGRPIPLPEAAPLASPTRDDESLVDPAAAIPVFSAINPAPFEIVDEEEHRALAPTQIGPPNPAEAAASPVPNLAVALRGEKKSSPPADQDSSPEPITHTPAKATPSPDPAVAAPTTSRPRPDDDAPSRYSVATLPPTPMQPFEEPTAAEETTDASVAASDASAAENRSHDEPRTIDAEDNTESLTDDLARDSARASEGDADPQATPLSALPTLPRSSPDDTLPGPEALPWATTAGPTTPTPTSDEASDDSHDLVATGPALHPVATGVPTGAKINQQAADKIRRGYSLAQRGAYYSARSEFIAVLRMLAQGKDHLTGQPRRSRALAAGLRALDEVGDFAPRGGALDADVDLSVITSSHRTPVAKTQDDMLPQQLMDVYFRYAQVQLGAAVAGEPAGSMALHALGKLHSQLGRVEAEQHPLATRFAYTYQQAALLAHNQNHLAAHELGVLMAESGHYHEAEDLLLQVAAREPHPQVLQNLARVQQQLGHVRLAAETKNVAAQMRTRYGSANGIAWVDPSVFSSQNRPNWQETSTPRVAERRP